MPPRGFDHPSTSLITTSSSDDDSVVEASFAPLTTAHEDEGQPVANDQRTIPPLEQATSSSETRHVSFGNAQIRVYTQVLGDHPFCTEGLPVSLGWEYREEGVVGLSVTEPHPCPRLSGEDRRAILESAMGGALEVRRIQRRLSRERQRNAVCQKRILRQSGFFRRSTSIMCVESE